VHFFVTLLDFVSRKILLLLLVIKLIFSFCHALSILIFYNQMTLGQDKGALETALFARKLNNTE
jgi:hypothetical protein